MDKFKVGQHYDFTDWFTGGTSDREVDKISDGKVTFKIERWELDGHHFTTETYDIDTDENGNESVLIYEYHGEEARIYAKHEVERVQGRTCRECVNAYSDSFGRLEMCIGWEMCDDDSAAETCNDYCKGECTAWKRYKERREYTSSATNGDYSPSNPWDAPGMSIRDFL